MNETKGVNSKAECLSDIEKVGELIYEFNNERSKMEAPKTRGGEKIKDRLILDL